MRVLVFLLITLFPGLSHAAGSALLRWQDTRQSVSVPQTDVTASKVWKLCALYPSLKDSYWLSVNYGMLEAAKKYGVSLKVFEAGGYRQFTTQKHKSPSASSGARMPFYWAAAQRFFRICRRRLVRCRSLR